MKNENMIVNPQPSTRRLRIGVFDSGLGGLTVVRALLEQIKGADFFYVADTAHAPYGEKSPEEILSFSLAIANYFVDCRRIDALVVACNTATSAAITHLRERFPNLIIVGTEPAVKPAVEMSKSGAVGVLATPATLKGDKYQQLVDRLKSKKTVKLYEQACPGLVEHIEAGTVESQSSRRMLESWLAPMRQREVDTIVLGCTHYPLAKETIARIMQREVRFLEAGEAIARRLKTLLCDANLTCEQGLNSLHLLVTGSIDKEAIKRIVPDYDTLSRLSF